MEAVSGLRFFFLSPTTVQRKARTQREEKSGMQLDVHSLSKLRQDGVPPTDDSPKFAYELGQDGKYGKEPAMPAGAFREAPVGEKGSS